MNCLICNTPIILYGYKYRCPRCLNYKLTDTDLTNLVGLLHYILPDKSVEVLVDIITRRKVKVNNNLTANPNILILKKGVYRIDINGENRKQVFFYTKT